MTKTDETTALVEAAKDLLAALDAADAVKRGDFYHERKDLREAVAALRARSHRKEG